MMRRGRSTAAARGILAVFVVFTLMALAGFATFGLHPSLLARVPSAAGTYGLALRVFPIGHVWLAFAVIAAYLSMRTDGRWLSAFLLLYVLSLTSELLGTGYGIPFGAYHYSAMLGPEWLGRVPILIPLSWFSMSVAAFGMSPGGNGRGPAAFVTRVGFTSLLLLVWDLSLDPAMSHATTYWIWGATGPYYGMPWSNLVGWYVTGIVLAAALWAVGANTWMSRLSRRWLAAFYGANVLLSLGMNAAAGLWLAVGAALAALAVTWAAMSRLARRDPDETTNAARDSGWSAA